jgi:hypothetical protein
VAGWRRVGPVPSSACARYSSASSAAAASQRELQTACRGKWVYSEWTRQLLCLIRVMATLSHRRCCLLLALASSLASEIGAAAQPVCWEAHTSDYTCTGYEDAGYVCVGEYCAAQDPVGTPSTCAVEAGCSVNHGTGRCEACGSKECQDLQSAVLALPACAGITELVADATGASTTQLPCTVSCAELWIAFRQRCGQFESEGLSDVGAACTATTAAILATAPRTITVNGLVCHPQAPTRVSAGPPNAVYELQPILRNGKAQYATSDGGWFLYWSGSREGKQQWLITYASDGDGVDDAEAFLYSDAETPPVGAAVWLEYCKSKPSGQRWTNVQLEVDAGSTFEVPSCETTFASLAPRFVTMCCGPGDAAGCGQNGIVPAECTIDCAATWSLFPAQCPQEIDQGDSDVTMLPFFTDVCSEILASLTVLEETATITVTGHQDFTFNAQSGTRYDVRVRVSEASMEPAPCTDNHYEATRTPGACDRLIATGQATCEEDFCGTCGYFAHACDRSCNFECTFEGITNTGLYVLPPGTTMTSQNTAKVDAYGTDKGLGFTAVFTGSFTIRVTAHEGSGSVTVSVSAVGTALKRSPQLRADGKPHLLTVGCQMDSCTFGYDGTSAYDGDSSGFDLALTDVVAGRAYAILLELPAGQTAAQVEATFYQVGASGGDVGFEPVIFGPMGDWSTTPPDHQSYAEHYGCTNEDRSCINLPSSFGIYPGGRFGRHLQATWVAPAAGSVLLRLVLNCDVVFFADVQAEGCTIDDELGTYACDCFVQGSTAPCTSSGGGSYSGRCESNLHLTVTPGAYYLNGRRRTQTGGDHVHQTTDTHAPLPTRGTVQRTDRIVVERADVEARAAAVWQESHDTGRRQMQTDGGAPHPPSLEEMLVSGSDANDLLDSLFTIRQQPHVVFPITMLNDHSGGHRRLQMRGDHLRVVIETHAPSSHDADLAEQRLIARLPGADSIPQYDGTGSCDLQARTEAVNSECCDEPTEDCSSGIPATCNVGCAVVVLPFFADCSNTLGKHASDFDDVVELCQATLVGNGRRLQSQSERRQLQTGGDHLHTTIETHAVCGLGSTDAGCTAGGQVKRRMSLLLDRDQAEAIARDEFAATPVEDQIQMKSAPNLDQMLVSGTPASALLTSLFVQQQEPQMAVPISYKVLNTEHRRLQLGGDRLAVTVETHAATLLESDQIVHRLAQENTGTLEGRRV